MTCLEAVSNYAAMMAQAGCTPPYRYSVGAQSYQAIIDEAADLELARRNVIRSPNSDALEVNTPAGLVYVVP